jgi:hypothetical protein
MRVRVLRVISRERESSSSSSRRTGHLLLGQQVDLELAQLGGLLSCEREKQVPLQVDLDRLQRPRRERVDCAAGARVVDVYLVLGRNPKSCYVKPVVTPACERRRRAYRTMREEYGS